MPEKISNKNKPENQGIDSRTTFLLIKTYLANLDKINKLCANVSNNLLNLMINLSILRNVPKVDISVRIAGANDLHTTAINCEGFLTVNIVLVFRIFFSNFHIVFQLKTIKEHAFTTESIFSYLRLLYSSNSIV